MCVCIVYRFTGFGTCFRWVFNYLIILLHLNLVLISRKMLFVVNSFIGQSGVEVLGILTSSVPDCFTDLPSNAQTRFKAYRFEIATKMSSVYEKMIVESRVLADNIFIKDKSYYKCDENLRSVTTCGTELSFRADTLTSEMIQSPVSSSFGES